MGPVTWRCPACDRRFGRRGQSHLCVPVVSLDAWFADRPPVQRQVCDRVLAHLGTVGPVEVDAAEVGILIKRERTFAELRPHRGHLRLSVLLDHDVVSPRVSRQIVPGSSCGFNHYAVFFVLSSADDVDEEIRDLLTESYESSPVA